LILNTINNFNTLNIVIINSLKLSKCLFDLKFEVTMIGLKEQSQMWKVK